MLEESDEALPALQEAPSSTYKVSIVVPTKNEAGNIEPLLQRIDEVMEGIPVEVIFVDDSTDNTAEVITQVGGSSPLDVAVIHRPLERRNGLGKAVVEGLELASAEFVVVMDGDLQHPPHVILQLLAKAEAEKLDMVVASRLAKGGSTAGLAFHRKIISWVLAFITRLVFPRNVSHISDPMTGFFLMRRASVSTTKLRPEGFKILLEILCRGRNLKVGEVPFEFGKRQAGESKANGQEMMRLFRQVTRLRYDVITEGLRAGTLRAGTPGAGFSGATRMGRFLAVGLSGIGVNTFLMFVFTDLLGFHYLLSAVFSTQGSTGWNFAWTEAWVFGDRPMSLRGLWKRMTGFFMMNNGMLLLRGPMLAVLVSSLGMNYLLANVVSLGLMTAVRYLLADKLIWGQQNQKGNIAGMRQKSYLYNVHNILSIRSMQRLPELGFFLTDSLSGEPDIDVTVTWNPHQYRTDDSIVYSELFGRLGFDIVINRSETQTKVYASRIIGLSPHVLYTNVVESLLRWTLVRKGYALMHGACVSFDGRALFITAQTDTGKTTTILFTIKDNLEKIRFLSDDMTILSRDGSVMSYPKPLTISQHTLQAVNAAPLSFKERMFLQLQSRLHSRDGRRFAMWLSHSKFPAATLNAVVQWLVPPPKFMVDRLVPNTQYGTGAQLAQIVLIERGEDAEIDIPDNSKSNIMVANAEDAYGFPPYPIIARQLSSWNGKDLHEAEKAIVDEAVKTLPAKQLRSSNYGWYKRLPALLEDNVLVDTSGLFDKVVAQQKAAVDGDVEGPKNAGD